MASRRSAVHRPSLPSGHFALPIVCVVANDKQFFADLFPELIPWFQVVLRHSCRDLARWTREAAVQAVILDLDLDPGSGGLAVLNELRKLNPEFVLLSFSASKEPWMQRQALQAGSDAHFRSPVDIRDLRLSLAELLRARGAEISRQNLLRQAQGSSRFQDFTGYSEPMRAVYAAIEQVAGSGVNVLIRGESGTGKELAARAIVALSRRAHQPYIRLNCAALPHDLIESELFGSERGAFTGATESRPGQIELSDQGTLFLDEIATLTLPLQTKLLRVLEDHMVQRLGGRTQRKIDFRLICATHENLEEMVRTGRFREDLYYRIHVVPIQLPALRERHGDIPLLCTHFLHTHCIANNIPPKHFDDMALSALEQHAWPGNVRELENLIQRLVITVGGDEIQSTHLPSQLLVNHLAASEAVLLPDSGTDFDAAVRQMEIALLTAALRRTHGNKAAAARLLQIDGQRIKYLCRKYALH
ncbi:MAG: sigma 54-interacting transcriptional regulator [Acidobacteriota bacterium]